MPRLSPEVLDLDPEALARSATAHAGYALALQRTERTDLRPWIASSLLIAAVHRSLVDPQTSREAFREAAKTYFTLGVSYYAVLAVCAQDRELTSSFVADMGDRRWGSDASLDSLEGVLTRAWLGGRSRRGFPEQPEGEIADDTPPSMHARVGRLSLPLRLYTRALTAAAGMKRLARDGEEWLPTFTARLERAAEPVMIAMQDRYHGRQLYSAVLPLEPEVLAACVAMLRIWESKGRKTDELLSLTGRATEQPVALMPLEVAAELVR